MRNVHMDRLQAIAHQYAEHLSAITGCKVELGGSLPSGTLLQGRNDIDLRVLVPEGGDTKEGIMAISVLVGGIVPFQKERPYGSPEEGNENFAVIHQSSVSDLEAGQVDIEVLVLPARVYVGYAKYQRQLPSWMLDAYVAAKWDALQTGDWSKYKAVKAEFYTMTRALHRAGFFVEEILEIYTLTSTECGRDWCSVYEMLVIASSPEEAIQLAEHARERGEVDIAFQGEFRLVGEPAPVQKGVFYQNIECE